MHESYSSSTFDNDIAILELDSNINLNDYAQPVCISKTRIGDNVDVTVSGWGTLSSGGSSPDKLQYVDIKTILDATCSGSNAYGNEYHKDPMLCAGDMMGGVDSCQGDSGGPLTQSKSGRHYLDGVVSWGYGCAGKNKPGIYARVSTYHDWIIEKTGIQFD